MSAAESKDKESVPAGGKVPVSEASMMSEAVQELVSTLRGGLAGAGPATDVDGGGLEARIAARRAQIVGSRGEVPPERLRAALAKRSPSLGLPAGTALLPSRQRLLAHRVAPASDAATAIVQSLRPLRPGVIDAAEVEAVVRSVAGLIAALRREAVEPEPRKELVDAKLTALFGADDVATRAKTAQQNGDRKPKGQLDRLRRVMRASRNEDDQFTSSDDVEQGNQLELLEINLRGIEDAFRSFFDDEAAETPSAIDRVPDVQAQLRVVVDSTADLRVRLHAAGADDAELAAPDGRLSGIEASLPRMTMARLLAWIEDLAGGSTAAELPVTGSIGLATLHAEADVLQPAVTRLAALGDSAAAHGAVGAALGDPRVREALQVLASQLSTITTPSGGSR